MASRNREDSLRGQLEIAVTNIRKMIDKDRGGASFTSFASDLEDMPKDPKLVNDWIKDKIRIYVETWVLPFAENALTKASKK